MTLLDYLIILVPMLVVATLTWVVSVFKKDVSIVDSLWSVFFVIIAVYLLLDSDEISWRFIIVFFLVVAWGIRLSFYITLRHWGESEDHRYKVIRKNNSPGFAFKSIYLIFWFQAVVAWVVALPVIFALKSNSPLNVFDVLGITFWLAGMYFETLSDYQLYKFKKDAVNKGKILIDGLWKYTRHPNYFGEFLIWWGYFLFSVAAQQYMAIVSPLLMTFLLLKFSGVVLLEKSMRSRPGYEEYIRNTNAFFPGFKRNKEMS